MSPKRETSPYVGLMPTTPHSAAGWRIDPPVSVPVAPTQSEAATAAAQAPGEPPGPGAGARRAPRRAARRAAGHVRERPRVLHRTHGAVLVRRAHGELVHVELAERDGARGGEARRHRRLVGRHEAAQDLRGARRLDALRAEDVLDAEGH